MSNPAISWNDSLISLRVCLNKILILEILRLAINGDGNKFEKYNRYQDWCVVLE